MIRDILRIFVTELGVQPEPQVVQRIEQRIASEFGGEQHYLPKHPKTQTMARVMAYGTTASAADVARELGISPQHVRRVRRLHRP